MLTAPLIVLAAIAWRVAREVSVLASGVRELHDVVKRQQTTAGAITPLLAVVDLGVDRRGHAVAAWTGTKALSEGNGSWGASRTG